MTLLFNQGRVVRIGDAMSKVSRELAEFDYTVLYQYYRERLVNIALSQFDWDGLPEDCNRRYLEWMLLSTGTAALINPKNTDIWVSLGYTLQGNLDMYGDPADILGVSSIGGPNIVPEHFELLYDNNTKTSLLTGIDLYARLLAETHATMRNNLLQQNRPYIIAAGTNMVQTIRQFFASLFNFSQAISVGTQFDPETVKVLDLPTTPQYNDIMQHLQDIWDEALAMLGVTNMSSKKERMITGEVQMAKQAADITMNSRLMNRVEFCERLNKKYGLNISVTARQETSDTEFQDPTQEEERDGELHDNN